MGRLDLLAIEKSWDAGARLWDFWTDSGTDCKGLSVVLDCQVDRIIEEGGITVSFAQDYSSDLLILSSWMTRGILKMTVFRQLTLWDGRTSVYRYLDDRVDLMGNFIKKPWGRKEWQE